MKTIVGIQFKGGGRVYYFDPLEYTFKRGDHAIVETVRGLELGLVPIGKRLVRAVDAAGVPMVARIGNIPARVVSPRFRVSHHLLIEPQIFPLGDVQFKLSYNICHNAPPYF